MLRKVLAATLLAVCAPSQSRVAPPGRSGEYKVLDFRLRLNQIVPRTMVVTEGRYLIRLSNPVSPDEIPLVLDDDKGRAVVNERSAQGKGRFAKLVDLDPGIHRLYVPGRPVWTVTIDVRKK